MDLKPETLARLERILASLEQLLPLPVDPIDWTSCRAAAWRRHLFSGCLEPVSLIDPFPLDDLLGIERQKKAVVDNTRQFLAGAPANNVLLWGARGTGKSTLVRALLTDFAPAGLRLVQLDRSDLGALPDIFGLLRKQPYRFLLLCDDLSFEAGEGNYKILKSALEGSVYAAPPNVLIYATSNRRHLLPEFQRENLSARQEDGEIHPGEAVEEKISLSDRFGLWVPFYPFSRELYLEVARQSLEKLVGRGRVPASVWDVEAQEASLEWARLRGRHCGRTATQFARHWAGRAMLKR